MGGRHKAAASRELHCCGVRIPPRYDPTPSPLEEPPRGGQPDRPSHGLRIGVRGLQTKRNAQSPVEA